jgi:hypothetical protein
MPFDFHPNITENQVAGATTCPPAVISVRSWYRVNVI